MGSVASSCKDNIISPIAFSPPKCSYSENIRNLLFINNLAFLHIDINAKYTILHSHGNACDLGQISNFLHSLSNICNVNILSYDYYGYGLNQYGPHKHINPTEENTFDLIDMALYYLVHNLGIRQENIILYGTSLGTGPTCYLASRNKVNTMAVILEAPYKSLTSVASETLACSTAMISPSMDMFRNIDYISDIQSPIHIFHGIDDTVISVKHSEELSRKNENATLYKLNNCGHNDINTNKIFYNTLENIIPTYTDF